MEETSFTSDASSVMLQMPAGKMILVMHLVILVNVFKHTAGSTTKECGIIGNIHQKLEVAEQIIKYAKDNLPSDLQSTLPMDCEDILENGEKTNGVYFVWPKNRILTGSISVYCDMDTDGGGWTVIQRRGNFSRDKDYFTQDWQAYKKGFGNLMEDFWIGNDYIYALSNQKQYSIRFDLGDAEGNKRFASYDTFWIEEENSNYTLHVAGYSGDAGDSFSYHDASQFSTADRDNDKSNKTCTSWYSGGWWFNNCHHAHLNGKYIPGKLEEKLKYEGLHWLNWTGALESLTTTEIKIRRNPSWIK